MVVLLKCQIHISLLVVGASKFCKTLVCTEIMYLFYQIETTEDTTEELDTLENKIKTSQQNIKCDTNFIIGLSTE